MLPKLKVLQSNFTEVDINSQGAFYFSYDTCIAFQTPVSQGLVVDHKFYSNTTRKHQNILINTYGGRYVEHEDFQFMHSGFEQLIEYQGH